MKIRKSILAAATAATVSVSGVVAAPAFAAEPTTTATPTATATATTTPAAPSTATTTPSGKATTTETTTPEEKTFGEKLKENSSDENGQWDPKAITAWISVFTAVLGLIGSVLTFAQKNFNFPKF